MTVAAVDVLFLSHSGFGGANVSLRNLIKDAVASGIRVGVVARNRSVAAYVADGLEIPSWIGRPGTFEHHESRSYGLRIYDIASFGLGALRFLVSGIHLIVLLRKVRARVLYLNSSVLIPYALIGWISRVAVVIHVRERVARGRWGVRRSFLRLCAENFADAIIYIGEEERAAFPIARTRSLVVFNYVRRADFPVAQPSDFSPSRPLRVLSLGGDAPLKGGPELLEMARRLSSQVRVALVGCEHAPIVESPLLDQALEAGRTNSIRIGIVEKVVPYFAWSDVVVFWTRAPHFPRPVFESWFVGRPVIVSKSGAETDLVKRRAAVVAPSDGVDDLVASILTCVHRFNELQRQARDNRSFAEEIFSERNFDRIGRVLHELIA